MVALLLNYFRQNFIQLLCIVNQSNCTFRSCDFIQIFKALIPNHGDTAGQCLHYRKRDANYKLRYFDVDVETDGGISIKGAGLKKEWILVLVALDQQDRPFLLYGTNAKVSDRDDVSLKSSEIMNFSMTFKMLKGTNGEQFHAWGLVTEDVK